MKPPVLSTRISVSAFFVAFLLLGLDAIAQSYPTRPVVALWPYPAGSASDLAMRIIATEAGKVLGQNVLVENRPGSAGRNTLLAMATAPKDGYLIGLGSSADLVQKGIVDPRLKVAPGKDFQPVSLLAYTYVILAAHPSVPFRDMKGLIAYARANPGKLTVSHSGIGTIGNFTAAALKAIAGVDLSEIPYKGGANTVLAAVKGEVQLTFGDTSIKQYVQTGQVIGIASISPQRWRAFPNLPTLAEQGVQGISATSVYGVFVPVETPPAIVATLHRAFSAAMKSPSTIAKLEPFGLEPVGSTPEEFAARLSTDEADLDSLVKKLGLKFTN